VETHHQQVLLKEIMVVAEAEQKQDLKVEVAVVAVAPAQLAQLQPVAK